jgi:hypothetical protein
MGFEVILPAIVGGVGWSVMGYLQAKAKEGKEISFEIPKLARSVIIGGALGAYLGFSGVTANITALDQIATNSAIYLPIVAVADKVVSIVWNAIRRVI